MRWLDDIRARPPEYKLRVMVAILVGALVLMVGLWIAVGNYRYSTTGSEANFFQSIGSSIHSLKNFH
jgi:hypothetical protein